MVKKRKKVKKKKIKLYSEPIIQNSFEEIFYALQASSLIMNLGLSEEIVQEISELSMYFRLKCAYTFCKSCIVIEAPQRDTKIEKKHLAGGGVYSSSARKYYCDCWDKPLYQIVGRFNTK